MTEAMTDLRKNRHQLLVTYSQNVLEYGMPHISPQLEYRHFEQMARLELMYYGEDFITPPQEAYRWYRRYPYTVVAALHDDCVVGFVNLFPVKESIAKALRAGAFNDHFLTLEGVVDIDNTGDEPLYMFLSCVVVDAAYRAGGLTRQLLCQAIEQYAHVWHRCTEVLTDNVTAEGERFSQRYGFHFICRSDHGSVVYTQTWADFVRAVMPQHDKIKE